jgi:predicted TIM-barrel enzyme
VEDEIPIRIFVLVVQRIRRAIQIPVGVAGLVAVHQGWVSAAFDPAVVMNADVDRIVVHAHAAGTGSNRARWLDSDQYRE